MDADVFVVFKYISQVRSTLSSAGCAICAARVTTFVWVKSIKQIKLVYFRKQLYWFS